MTPDPNDRLPLPQLRELVRGNRGRQFVAVATLTRWITDGCRAQDGQRIRLPATRAGFRWLVAPADLDAFFTRLAAAPSNGNQLQENAPNAD